MCVFFVFYSGNKTRRKLDRGSSVRPFILPPCTPLAICVQCVSVSCGCVFSVFGGDVLGREMCPCYTSMLMSTVQSVGIG